MSAPPLVSVIIPTFESHLTVAGCLEHLRAQTFRDFEVIVVDSSPTAETAEVVGGGFPEVRFERSRHRLLPHAARNRGVELSRAELLVFTDPDIYGAPDWLERLVTAHTAGAEIVIGAIVCHGSRWLDRAVHLTKFAKWLPGGRRVAVDTAPTANMLCSRTVFDALGGFDGDLLLGDADFAWRARRAGHELWFEPGAVAAHHHLHALGSFLTERYRRGVLFGELRLQWFGAGHLRRFAYLAVSVFPLRLARILVLTAGHGARGGEGIHLLRALPVVAAGHAAWLLGESRAYLRGAPDVHREGAR